MAGGTFRLENDAVRHLAGNDEEQGRPFPLENGKLHEIHARGDDRAAALAFALCGGGTGTVVYVRAGRQGRVSAVPCGDGLGLLGMEPARLLVVETANERDLLRAGLEAARCPGVERVLLETAGRFSAYDLTAGRRLALAAERSGNRVIVLRHDTEPRPGAAHTRWAIAAAPSVPQDADTPGRSALQAELLRWRGGPAGRCWRLEWDGDHGTFRDAAGRDAAGGDAAGAAPLSGAVVSLASMREGAGGGKPGRFRAA